MRTPHINSEGTNQRSEHLRFPIIEALLEEGHIQETRDEIQALTDRVIRMEAVVTEPGVKSACVTAREGLQAAADLLDRLHELSRTAAHRRYGENHV
ncbi:MAG TPA: hypothetical protein PLV45_11535 [bacterium]|nr:hypothetical protein [bacterium]